MCVILPVDHISCSHTVAIWQHCIDAPRSKAYGLEPCKKIRQCSRSIITRKKCIHCGGPRFFARRGGVAERGNDSQRFLKEKEETRWLEANDSGYHSDAIPEEDEPEDDDDFAISPRATPRVPFKSRRRRESIDEVISPRSSVRDLKQQRPQSRRSSWRPNLKRELTQEQDLFPRKESLDSQASSYIEDNIGRAKHSHWPSLDASVSQIPKPSTPPRRPALPPIDTTTPQRSPIRKNSTLLHPSSPSTPPMEIMKKNYDVSPISPTFKPEDSAISLPIRKSSTLLHPSSPPTESPTTTQSAPVLPTLSTLPKRPAMPPRKTSTLLHPSSPPEERPTHPTKIFSYQLPTPPMSSRSYHSSDSSVSSVSSNSSSKASTPNFSLKGQKNRVSVLHSALSDSESEYSDQEEVNDCCDNESGGDSEGEIIVVEAIVATAARMARASRVEFQGAHWRSISSSS
jgi:hypothetical protein